MSLQTSYPATPIALEYRRTSEAGSRPYPRSRRGGCTAPGLPRTRPSDEYERPPARGMPARDIEPVLGMLGGRPRGGRVRRGRRTGGDRSPACMAPRKVLPTFNPAFRAPSYTAPGSRRGPASKDGRPGQEARVLGVREGSQLEVGGLGGHTLLVADTGPPDPEWIARAAGSGTVGRGFVSGARAGIPPGLKNAGSERLSMGCEAAVCRAASATKRSSLHR